MGDLDIRPLTARDAPEFARLAAAIEADHMTSWRLSEDEFREIVDLPIFTLAGCFDGDRLVAWSGHLAGSEHEGEVRYTLIGDVDPAELGRGHGTVMATRALEVARCDHARVAPEAAVLFVSRMESGREDQADLLGRLGFQAERYRYFMLNELGRPTSLERARTVPADLEVVGFDPAGDAELVRLTHNEVFEDYPNNAEMTADSWDGFMVRAAHNRAELSWLVRDPAADGRIAAYLFTHEYSAPMSGVEGGREAYVPFLGTRREYRGRGLGAALLQHAARAWLDAGFTRASLDVDVHNPSGALGLYERSGFVVHRRFDELTLREPPVG